MDNKHPLKEYFKVFFLQPLPTIRIHAAPKAICNGCGNVPSCPLSTCGTKVSKPYYCDVLVSKPCPPPKRRLPAVRYASLHRNRHIGGGARKEISYKSLSENSSP